MKRTIYIISVVAAALLMVLGVAGLFGQTAQGQTTMKEDTLAFSVTYTPRQALALEAYLGPDWRQIVKQRHWREAWKNLINEAKDRLRFQSSIIFDEGSESYMTDQELRQRDRIRDSTLVRKARYEAERRIADSIAAAQQTQGSVTLREVDHPQLAGLGIGKALSQRLEFTDGWVGGGGAIPTSSRHGGESQMLTEIAVLGVVGVAIIVLIIYGIVQLVN